MDTDELRQLIVQKCELLMRETFSYRAFNHCEDMSDGYRDFLSLTPQNIDLAICQ